MPIDDDEFLTWILDALSYGLDFFSEHPIKALVLIQNEPEGEPIVINVKCLGGGPDGHANVGREIIGTHNNAHHYGLLWRDSFIGDDGETAKGLFIEAGDQSGRAIVVAQQYRPKKSGELVLVGEPFEVSEAPNIWGEGNGKAQAKAYSPKSKRENETDVDPCLTVEDLAQRSITIAIERMQEGDASPFLCLIEAEGLENRMVIPQSEDAEVDEIISALREHVPDNNQSELYAIVYFATTEVDGKEVDIVVSETGDRLGNAPVFSLTYKVSKSNKLTTGEIEFDEDIANLWGSEEDQSDMAHDPWVN